MKYIGKVGSIRILLATVCRCLLHLFSLIGDTITSNNITFGVMSCSYSFMFDRSITEQTVEYIDQSDNSSWRVLRFDTYKLVGWNMSLMSPHTGCRYMVVHRQRNKIGKKRYIKLLILTIKFIDWYACNRKDTMYIFRSEILNVYSVGRHDQNVKTTVQNKQKEDEFGLEMLQRGIQSGARED